MFTLYSADFINAPSNCSYPHKTEVRDAADLAAAVSRDYVCAEYASKYFIWVAYAGVACFGLCALFQLITLPTEYNASRRAIRSLESCMRLSDDEIVGSKKVLNAAALTYVAALTVTVMQLLRLLIRVKRNDRTD